MLIIRNLSMGGKIRELKWPFFFSFLLRMIIFAVYFYPLLHRNGTNTGLRYPLTVVRSGPHSGDPMKEKTGLTLIAVSSLFEKAEDAGMETISFLSTR